MAPVRARPPEPKDHNCDEDHPKKDESGAPSDLCRFIHDFCGTGLRSIGGEAVSSTASLFSSVVFGSSSVPKSLLKCE